MNTQLWTPFIKVLQHEVVPALGCTEPVSVALAAAIGAARLSAPTQCITVNVSPNLMKNGMGVGIPGTGMVGLPIAAALGAIAGNPNAGLEVLEAITPHDVEQAKQLVDAQAVSMTVAPVNHILYAKVTVCDGDNNVAVTIADAHTHVISIEENGLTMYQAPITSESCETSAMLNVTAIMSDAKAQDIDEFARHAPLADIEFIEQAQQLNDALSKEGLQGDYGLQIGATLQRNIDRGLLSNDLLTQVLMRTSAASDARMDGAMKAAMSNSGSGNQGIAATMPVVATAQFINATREQTLRALVLTNLMAIYIKAQQHKLSALCGATTAGMGATAGITYLLGGDYQQVSYAVSSMIGDVAGVICDGAKTACAMKVSSSAGAALKAALMAIDNQFVSGQEGIVANNVDDSIANLSALANGSMMQTDVQILDIMVSKSV